ncbi:MAG: lysophospholipid acyltransferase family protein [Ignavibacteria bacterium]|nr:lysophospholipid acyltransferase family protein [Ignavibacteria bacterium]
MKNKFEYFLLKFLSFLVSRLSLTNARRLANLLAFIFFYFIPIRKKVVTKNLKIAFPSISNKDLTRLTKKVYQNLFIVLIEILYLPFLSKEEIEKLVEVRNIDLVEKALRKDKGLIFVSAHFGNWEIMAIASAIKINKTFSIVIKPLRNPYVDAFINDWRTKFGNKVIPLGISVKNVYRELLEKKVIALLADQRASLNSLEMEFFSKKTHVYEGPAVLSIKTGAPVIFAIPIRQPNNIYLIELIEIPIPENGTENEKIYKMTKNYITILENYIRAYPEQWFWFHNRWKH